MYEEHVEAIEMLPVMFPPLDFDLAGKMRETGDGRGDGAGVAQMYRIVDDFCLVYRERKDIQTQAATVLSEALWRLVLAVGCRNRESPARVLRVGLYSALLADAIGCPERYCDELQQAALLRDIGMIGIPDPLGVLPYIPSESELALLQSHTRLGFEMLGGGRIAEFNLAAEVALSHHERFDGTGYPQQLVACAIPLSGRIVAIAEYFERLSSERDFRLPLPEADVVDLVSSQHARRFDPQLVVALLESREALQRVREAYGEESILLSDSAPARDAWQQFRNAPKADCHDDAAA